MSWPCTNKRIVYASRAIGCGGGGSGRRRVHVEEEGRVSNGDRLLCVFIVQRSEARIANMNRNKRTTNDFHSTRGCGSRTTKSSGHQAGIDGRAHTHRANKLRYGALFCGPSSNQKGKQTSVWEIRPSPRSARFATW